MNDPTIVMCDSVAVCQRLKGKTCYHDLPHPEGNNCRYTCTDGINNAALCRPVTFVCVTEEKPLDHEK